MPRDIDAAVQSALEGVERRELLLVFLTITIDGVDEPIRLVCEENRGVSYANGQPINYYHPAGVLHAGLPFGFQRLSDNDEVARGAVNIPAFHGQVGEFLRAVVEPARVKIDIYAQSAWDDDVDVLNARPILTTPELVYNCDHLFLRDAQGGKSVIQCTLGGYDFTQEPLGPRATKDLCPDLYR